MKKEDALCGVKIHPLYDVSLHVDLGYSPFDLSYEPSLESQVSRWKRGDNRCSGKEDQVRFTINKCPELVRSTVWNLRGKHENLPTQAAVQRFLTRAGVVILERIPGLKLLNERRRKIYQEGDEKDRIEFFSNSYSFRYRISLTNLPMTVYAIQWAGSKIVEISSDLGLPQEIVITMSLIAGMTTSEKWVPLKYMNVMLDETLRFATWANELSNKLE